MSATKIAWTDAVWNPVTGCTPVSHGCDHCYARRMVEQRLSKNPKATKYFGKPFSLVQCHEAVLEQPWHWRKPRRVFVNSMGDLFHPDVPDEFIERVFDTMSLCGHTFQILTKRPRRMREYAFKVDGETWDNIWFGVSVEDQETADERISLLLRTPAAHRFVSAEPLLRPVNIDTSELDLVIVGGETGPDARPMDPDWVSDIRDQCRDTGTPFFFKSWGDWSVHVGHRRFGRLLDGREHNGEAW